MSTINNLNDNNVSKLLLDAGEIDQSIYEGEMFLLLL